jgi:hypothetical protein
MAWKPGQSGNPTGSGGDKPFLGALKRAIAQGDPERLRNCAEMLLDKAAAGESWAMQMLADRLDGKATQEVVMRRAVEQMSDEQLLAIAAGSSQGTASEARGESTPGVVH